MMNKIRRLMMQSKLFEWLVCSVILIGIAIVGIGGMILVALASVAHWILLAVALMLAAHWIFSR